MQCWLLPWRVCFLVCKAEDLTSQFISLPFWFIKFLRIMHYFSFFIVCINSMWILPKQRSKLSSLNKVMLENFLWILCVELELCACLNVGLPYHLETPEFLIWIADKIFETILLWMCLVLPEENINCTTPHTMKMFFLLLRPLLCGLILMP